MGFTQVCPTRVPALKHTSSRPSLIIPSNGNGVTWPGHQKTVMGPDLLASRASGNPGGGAGAVVLVLSVALIKILTTFSHSALKWVFPQEHH